MAEQLMIDMIWAMSGTELFQYIVLLHVVLYLIFILVMRLKHKREREGGLKWYDWGLLLLFYPPGWLIDVFLNVVVYTVVFTDAPHEWTLSKRIDRYLTKTRWKGTYQRRWSKVFAKILNKIDPGHVG